MKILIASGGTGGHLYPAVALVQSLRKKVPTSSILWIGGMKGFDKRIVKEEKVKFRSINFSPLPRSFSFKWLNFTLQMIISFIQSIRYIYKFKPDVVVGMGSFHSYPVVLSAFFLRNPTVICEQNVYPSLTNKMLLPFASKIALSFSESVQYLPSWGRKKAIITGNPVREKILIVSKKEGVERLDLEKGKFTLLFLGGSQGARHLNKVAVQTLYLIQEKRWGRDIQFILITGEKDYTWVREKLNGIKIKGEIFSYLSDIHYALAASDLVICRSGATTISEITARGLPCVLIPYPFATKQHQLKNALFLKQKGAAAVIVQKQLCPSLLEERIEKILNDQKLQDKMKKASRSLGRPEAAKTLADLILELGRS